MGCVAVGQGRDASWDDEEMMPAGTRKKRCQVARRKWDAGWHKEDEMPAGMKRKI